MIDIQWNSPNEISHQQTFEIRFISNFALIVCQTYDPIEHYGDQYLNWSTVCGRNVESKNSTNKSFYHTIWPFWNLLKYLIAEGRYDIPFLSFVVLFLLAAVTNCFFFLNVPLGWALCVRDSHSLATINYANVGILYYESAQEILAIVVNF